MPPKVYSKLFNNEPSNNYTIDVDKENVHDVVNTKDIFLFIFKNLIKMFIISVILSLMAFYGLVNIFKHLTVFDMIINIESCLYSIITLFVLIIILSLISLRKFSKIEITNLLRS